MSTIRLNISGMTTLSTGYSSNINFHDQGVGFMPTKKAERSKIKFQKTTIIQVNADWDF